MVRLTALLLTVATGFSGLVYEVTWQKYLATLLGSDSEATAAVLGLFLGGLAVGYALFGVVTRGLVRHAAERSRSAPQAGERGARLLFVYGGLEAGIGIYALVFPVLFGAVQALSFALVPTQSGVAFAVDVALCALLVLPPAVLMGGTIPILTQALARSLDDATRFHALVYGFNTAGAFAGALAAGYWLVPALGLVGVLRAMAVVNLFAGAVFAAIGWRPAPRRTPAAAGSPREVPGFAAFAAIAGLVGFAMMTVQTVLIRLGGLSFGASQFTFSMVVAVFVLCIAIGSLLVSAFARIPRGVLVFDLWALVLLLFLLYTPLQDSPYWAHVLRSLFRSQPEGFYPYYLSAFLCVLAVIGPPVVLSGATLPLIFDRLRHEVGDLGEVAGRLYSWNTVGSLGGALLGGYALFYWLDLHEIYRLAIAAVAVAAVVATTRVFGVGRIVSSGVLLAPVLVAIVLLPAWAPERLSAGLFRIRAADKFTFLGPDPFFANYPQGTVEYYDDDPTSSVAVKQLRGERGQIRRNIVNNGKSDGAVPREHVTMALASLVPALLADRAERGFVIGYGTGVTAGELASLETVREVVVAEISPAVVDAAPLFDYANQYASQNPKVEILRSDAYRALLRMEGSFDVIASEPSNPWVTGVEMLFSREFLIAARDRLSPGGVYGQWFHTYETSPETIAMVFRTYASVFDHVAVWYAKGSDLLLLGITDPDNALDLDRIQRRAARPDFTAALDRCEIRSIGALIAHELLPLGVIHAAELPGDVHTLLHPQLSYLAARAFFAGGEGRLPPTFGVAASRVGARNSLVRRLVAAYGGELPEDVRASIVTETCKYRPRECVTLMAQWTHEVPKSAARVKLRERIRMSPTLSRTTTLRPVRSVSELYGDGAALDAGDPLGAAHQATSHFENYYHHAAPFPRERLATLWRRCQADPALRAECLEGRAEAERTLGDLNATIVPKRRAALR